jgi:hypothetical protein
MDLAARAPRTPPPAALDAGSGHWSALVLADAGTDMWLVRVRFPEPPRRGLVFWFRELQWQVERAEPFGCRAVPAAM